MVRLTWKWNCSKIITVLRTIFLLFCSDPGPKCLWGPFEHYSYWITVQFLSTSNQNDESTVTKNIMLYLYLWSSLCARISDFCFSVLLLIALLCTHLNYLEQSEACIQVTWSMATNHRPEFLPCLSLYLAQLPNAELLMTPALCLLQKEWCE